MRSSSRASSKVSRSSETWRDTARSNSRVAMSRKSEKGLSSILFSFLPTSSAMVSFFVGWTKFLVEDIAERLARRIALASSWVGFEDWEVGEGGMVGGGVLGGGGEVGMCGAIGWCVFIWGYVTF